MNVINNTRYYKWINDDIEELIICKIFNDSKYKVRYTKGEHTGDTATITDTELSEYTKLTPDGCISFSVVSLQKIKDVMVCIIRTKDKSVSALPYAVCRQCVLDLFAKQLYDKDYCGISISMDSCPADVPFNEYFGCEKIDYSYLVSYYIGDSLDYILSLFKHDKFNTVLEELFRDHCMYISNNNKYIAESYKSKVEVDGYCKELTTLLSLNNFEYDLYKAFDIIRLDIPKDQLIDDNVLSEYATVILSNILQVHIAKSLVIPYDKDIDLKEIKRSYVLITDADGVVYVVAYTGTKFNLPLEQYESYDNIRKLYNHFKNDDSVADAFSHIVYNRSKYQK